MPKTRTYALFLAAMVACVVQAQAPSAGRIVGKSYVNKYFHISFAWPATLNPRIIPPQTTGSGNLKAYAFPLFSALQGDQPYGVTVVAEKLYVAGPHSTGIRDSAEFIERIKGSLRPGPVLSNITSSRKKSPQGLMFDQLDYLQSGKPASVMATQIGQYLIVFKCSAQSVDDMMRMQQSALALRKLP